MMAFTGYVGSAVFFFFFQRFEQKQPVSYLEHKESLLNVLETLDWPITYEDVMLLEDEILTGLTYLRQATELQHASKEEIQRICPLHLCPAKVVGSITAASNMTVLICPIS